MLATLMSILTLPAWLGTASAEATSQDPGRQDPKQWRVEVEQSVRIDRSVRKLALSTRAGGLEVLAGQGDRIEIEAVATAAKKRVDAADVSRDFGDHVAVSTENGVLTIVDAHEPEVDAEGRSQTVWAVSIRVLLPRELALEAATDPM